MNINNSYDYKRSLKITLLGVGFMGICYATFKHGKGLYRYIFGDQIHMVSSDQIHTGDNQTYTVSSDQTYTDDNQTYTVSGDQTHTDDNKTYMEDFIYNKLESLYVTVHTSFDLERSYQIEKDIIQCVKEIHNNKHLISSDSYNNYSRGLRDLLNVCLANRKLYLKEREETIDNTNNKENLPTKQEEHAHPVMMMAMSNDQNDLPDLEPSA